MGFNKWRGNRIFQPCVQGMMSIPGGMVNFTSHLDSAKGCPDSWVCLWRCFQKRLAFELVDRAQQVVLLRVGGCHPIHQGPEWNKKVEEGWICSPPDWLSWDVDLVALSVLVVLRTSDPGWNLQHQLPSSWVFKLHQQFSWVSSVQRADCGTSQPP